jgi:hypothetical protein
MIRAVAIVAAVAWAVGCTGVATTLGGRPGPEAGLIRGKMPERAHGVTHVDRLTDGIASTPDDPPRTDLTSVMAGSDAFVIYDLGRETAVGCAVVIADGDDRYTLALSHDGASFAPLWTADSTPDRGMQPRVGRPLRGTGRYLRLTADGGDGGYAVSELAVADVCPARWPPALALQQGTPLVESATLKIWVFAAAAVAFIVGYRRRMPDFLKLLIAIPAGVGVALGVQLVELWPLPGPVARALLLAVALVVAAAGGRIAVSRLSRRRAAS